MPVWAVIPKFSKLVSAAMKKAGGTPAARQKVIKENPSWFKYMPGKAGKKAGSTPAKAKPKATTAKKGKGGFSEVQLEKYRDMYRNRKNDKRWDRLSPDIKNKLLK
tara:strand:- start:19290 stop:19607 length:318 start_codon:yes stop_codon:yes gene_type:complete